MRFTPKLFAPLVNISKRVGGSSQSTSLHWPSHANNGSSRTYTSEERWSTRQGDCLTFYSTLRFKLSKWILTTLRWDSNFLSNSFLNSDGYRVRGPIGETSFLAWLSIETSGNAFTKTKALWLYRRMKSKIIPRSAVACDSPFLSPIFSDSFLAFSAYSLAFLSSKVSRDILESSLSVLDRK